jgi:AP-1 complex subunit gamma-1
MATKLRDLIRSVRTCKTAAEERAIVSREKALIRTSFADNEEEYRARNVAKLLFINMLGHDTDFGQIECLKLITSQNFADKKIGYLGLTQLFNEKSEVLMMATHRMRTDLQSSTHYVVALALSALSEITTADMCKELAPEVCKLLTSGNNYVKKKAALAATRVIRRVPELTEEFIEKIPSLMEERHHGVLLATLSLVEEILEIRPEFKEKFKKYVPLLIKVLKNLVSSYSGDYEISGIIDPFLQVQIIVLFRRLGEGNEAISEEINDVLTQVSTNTPANKNTGNAVLYECVRTILVIESSTTLRTLAINILGKFLATKESSSSLPKNLRYVALASLQKVVKYDLNAVQKHKGTIIDCLKENDISIKKLALDLLHLITNEKNIESIVKEMLNYILVSEADFLQELTLKICNSVERYAPNRRWHVDTIIKVLTLAGNHVKDESVNSLIHIISATPELQAYCVNKLFFSLRENLSQDGLAKVALWCVGEYASTLISGKATSPDNTPVHVSQEEIVGLVDKVLARHNLSEQVKEYALTCLIKLYTKFNSNKEKIRELIDSQTTSPSLEVQQRACEYLQLLDHGFDTIRGAIVDVIPPLEVESVRKPVGDATLFEAGGAGRSEEASTKSHTTGGGLLDDDLLGGMMSTPATTTQPTTTGNTVDILGDIFSSNPTTTAKPQTNVGAQDILNLYGNTGFSQPVNQGFGIGQNINYGFGGQTQQQSSYDPLGGLLGMGTSNPVNTLSPGLPGSSNLNLGGGFTSTNTATSPTSSDLVIKAVEDNNLEVLFQCKKDNQNTAHIVTKFNNKSSSQINNVVFQVAVQKHCKLNMNPISSNTIPAYSNGNVTQIMKIENTAQGQKAIALKLKVVYDINGMTQTQEKVVNSFPVTF